MTAYTVFVDDNAHYQDPDERYEHATFHTYQDALAACRQIVDSFLISHHKPGMRAAELYDMYTSFGEDPFISPDGPGPRFSAWDYAKQRSQELCAG